MKNFFSKKVNTALSLLLVVLSVIITVQTVFASSVITVGESTADTAQSDIMRVNLNYRKYIDNQTKTQPQTTTEPTEATTKAVETTVQPTTKKPKATKPKTKKTTTAPTTQSVAFATAIPPKVKADYNAQWNAGYLVAIDNPDTNYKCGQVTLCDNDRDLLERLCMGEFGSGGFIGAALIAQAVKNAMCFDGYTSVQAIIDGCHYTGRTDVGTNSACKQAVSYIFDQNHDAVQHRILYMYNPNLVASAFHESQNYILTYQQVRFFDRWNY